MKRLNEKLYFTIILLFVLAIGGVSPAFAVHIAGDTTPRIIPSDSPSLIDVSVDITNPKISDTIIAKCTPNTGWFDLYGSEEITSSYVMDISYLDDLKQISFEMTTIYTTGNVISESITFANLLNTDSVVIKCYTIATDNWHTESEMTVFLNTEISNEVTQYLLSQSMIWLEGVMSDSITGKTITDNVIPLNDKHIKVHYSDSEYTGIIWVLNFLNYNLDEPTILSIDTSNISSSYDMLKDNGISTANIYVISSDIIWVETTNGTFYSDDDGDTWIEQTLDVTDIIFPDELKFYLSSSYDILQITPISLDPWYVPVNDIIIEEPPKKKSGGGCNDCTPPTLAYNSEGRKLVDNGICINDTCMDGGYFHTEYPMQNTFLYYPNVISTTYYENGGASNIKLTQLGIGVKEIGSSISQSQALIEVYMDYFSNDLENPKIKEIILNDPDGIIDNYNATISLVPCQEGDVNNNCLQTEYTYSYKIVPESPVLMSNAIDYKRNVINSYFNDGLLVYDPTPEILPQVVLAQEEECIIKMVPKRNNVCQFLPLIDYEISKAEQVINNNYLIRNDKPIESFDHNNKMLRQYAADYEE